MPVRGLLLAFALLLPCRAQIVVHLSAETNRAFDDYVKSTEARMRTDAPLDPTPGNVTIAAGNASVPFSIKDGLVHDWIGSTIAPGASMDKALALLQGYDDYKKIYGPEVTDSKLLSHDGNHWHMFLRLYKRQVFTIVLNTEYEIEYRPLGGGRWAIDSRSTKVAEVDDGKEQMPGTGWGFVWRLNSYWLLEPRPQGLYLQCRSISLSRDIPAGLGWMVKPMVIQFPRDSLKSTLEATVRALR